MNKIERKKGTKRKKKKERQKLFYAEKINLRVR